MEAALAQMEGVYGFYKDERDVTAQCLLDLLLAEDEEPQALAVGFFDGVVFPDETVDLAAYQNVPAAYEGMAGLPAFDPSTDTSDSLLHDSFQRDLTMNAIYYDLSNGDLVDFHGGIRDIREHVLNTMVDSSAALKEDFRKGLRAMRFAARYGFALSDSLDKTLRTHGAEYLENTERADIASNVSKLMNAGYAVRSCGILREYGLLDEIYPPLIRLADNADYLDYLDRALAYLDEQETSFDLSGLREGIEGMTLLAHDMEDLSSRFLKDAVRESEYFKDALALLNRKALTDPSLAKQAAFWRENAEAPEEALDAAA